MLALATSVPNHVWHVLSLLALMCAIHYYPSVKTYVDRKYADANSHSPPAESVSLTGNCLLAEEAKGWPIMELFENKTSKDVCRPRDQHGANEHVRKMGVLEKRMREALRDTKAHATAACEYGIFSRVVMVQPKLGDFVFMMNPAIVKAEDVIECSSIDSVRGRRRVNRSRVIHIEYDHPVELADNLFAPKRSSLDLSNHVACSYQAVDDLMNRF